MPPPEPILTGHRQVGTGLKRVVQRGRSVGELDLFAATPTIATAQPPPHRRHVAHSYSRSLWNRHYDTRCGACRPSRLPHADADTFYWLPTDPPFTTPRPREARLALLLCRIGRETSWVFSGSAISWATPVEPLYDLIVFLHPDLALRMERLRRREIADYGARIVPGGDMSVRSRQFFEWAAAYDSVGLEHVRSLANHELWPTKQRCPVLRLDPAACGI